MYVHFILGVCVVEIVATPKFFWDDVWEAGNREVICARSWHTPYRNLNILMRVLL